MLKETTQIAKDAGKILMNYYGKKTEAKYKNDGYFDAGSIVSKADKKTEAFIVSRLKKLFPDHGIYSEEIGWINKKSDYTWYIDPLDGTSNFLRNIPLFGISIGLLYKDKPFLGVLYFPALDLIVYAEKGKGAYANSKKIHVSKRKLNESLYYAGGYYRGKTNLNKKIADKVGLVKTIDSTSHELAQIAMGDAELYELRNSIHDVAAGIIIVEEAGGKTTDEKGNEWTPKSKHVVISNGIIHKDVINILKKS